MTRLAVCQLCLELGKIDSNISASLDAVREAADRGAEIVLLPELADTGYCFADAAEARGLASPADGSKALAAWTQVAADRGLVIVGGFCELDGDRIYNSAVILDGGELRAVYRKAHLWNREKLIFTPGNEPPPVVPTRLGRLSVCICYDVEFPEWTRLPALSGAQILAAPVNWPRLPRPERERPSETVKAQAAAAANGIYVAVADRCGDERGVSWVGGSAIFDPRGYPLCGPLLRDEPAVQVAEIDVARADDKTLNDHNDLLGDRRTDLYGLELR
jgi:5-aminopentanamidase